MQRLAKILFRKVGLDRRASRLAVFASVFLFLAGDCVLSQATNAPLQLPTIRSVRIVNDAFWEPKQAVYRTASIANSWFYLAGDLEDDEALAGWRSIPRRGDRDILCWHQYLIYRLMEGIAYGMAGTNDTALEARMDGLIDVIGATQATNGYCNGFLAAREKNQWLWLDHNHDGITIGHLIEAAVAHHEVTGRPELLEIAKRVADNVYDVFITQGKPGYDGHAELEIALVRLYRATGDARYLELAEEWIERRGQPWPHEWNGDRVYFMDDRPIREYDEIVGHAVRALFYVAGAAEVAIETGDESLKIACRRLWDNMVTKKVYVIGGVGSDYADEAFGPAYDLPNRSYTETCSSCAVMFFADVMFRMDRDGKYADMLELALYNSVLHGISLDGTTTYYNNPLSDTNHLRDNNWVCCPPMVNKTLLRVPQYIHAYDASNLYVNLFIGSVARLPVADSIVTVRQVTDYPRTGVVTVHVTPDTQTLFTLRVRMPGWCTNGSIQLFGGSTNGFFTEKGYACMTRIWQAGDGVTLNLPMPVERIEAHPNVTENHGKVALKRGPMIYGFESTDNGGGSSLSDIPLPLDPAFTTSFNSNLLGGVTVIQGQKAGGGTFTALPFYVLANRGNASQFVWASQEWKREFLNSDWDGVLYRPWSLTFANPSNWTAYNDVGWASGQLSDRITTYSAAGGGTGGPLIDYDRNGFLLPAVQLSITGGVFENYGFQTQAPDPGSDADTIFGGIVDCNVYGSFTSGTLRVSFTNLNSSSTYSVVMFANRGVNSAAYTDRWTRVTISGVPAFSNNSSTGSTITTTSISNDTTQFITGWNNAGRVFRYDAINPGSDGVITFSLRGMEVDGKSAYLNAFKIQGEP